MGKVAVFAGAALAASQYAPAIGHAEAENAPSPPLMECTLFAGEGQLLDGHCRVLTLPNGHILIKEEASPSFIFLVKPNRKRDEVFWNGAGRSNKTLTKLGAAFGIENCWMSVPKSEVHFSLCLTPPRLYQGEK
ncbi:MAG: hypothetical protein RLZZ136_1378 [Pseudomonadota bacterium]